MENIKCKRCNRKLTNKESIKLGYGKTCFRIMKLEKEQKPKENSDIQFLKMEIQMLKREMRKIKSFGNIQNIPINQIKQEKIYVPNKNMEKFGNVINELKSIFTENFHYKNYLKPEVRENIEKPPNFYI